MNNQEIQQVMELNKTYKFRTDRFSFSIEQKDGKKKFVTGYISVTEVDLYNDLVTPAALKSMLRQINESVITLDYQHESFRDDNTILPVGKITEAKIDSKGLWVKAILNEHSPKFKALWGSIKDGFINAFSIAFKPLKTITKAIGDAEVRLIQDLQLLNVAVTGNPVNRSAKITEFGMKTVMLKAINDMESLGDDCVLVPRELLNKLQETKMKKENLKDEGEAEAPVEAPAEEPAKEESAEKPEAEATAEPEAKPSVEKKDEAEAEKPAEEPEPAADEEAAAEVEKKSKDLLGELQKTVDKQGKELKDFKEKGVFKSPTPNQSEAEMKSQEINMLSLIK